MTLSRHMITAGVAALSLAVTASPAVAKHGGDGAGDTNNTVVTISPDAPAPFTGSSGSGSGGGGGGKRAKCSIVSFDPITGVGTGVCTTNRV